MPQLPPLASIEALDHLARLGTMARAAAALNQTPGAVSHKIKTLEARLGFRLTEVRGRGVVLTLQAERYLEAARPALAALRQAASRAATGETIQLAISAPPGFAASWLAPRIGGFQTAHPNIALTLGTGGAEGAADVEISFRSAAAPGEALLATPQFFPVIAPDLAYGGGAPTAIRDLARHRLLHLYDARDWRDWGAAAGQPDLVAKAQAMTFTDANILFAAASAGVGIALGDETTCAAALRSGALVRLFARTAPSGRSYYAKAADTDAAQAFRRWIVEEMGGRAALAAHVRSGGEPGS